MKSQDWMPIEFPKISLKTPRCDLEDKFVFWTERVLSFNVFFDSLPLPLPAPLKPIVYHNLFGMPPFSDKVIISTK